MSGPAPVRILVVDDSPIFLEAFVEVLEEDATIEVVATAADGREAVEKVITFSPDLVAMDVMMPVMDGLEAVEEIMCSRPTPILLLTGDPSRQGTRWSFEALSRGALELMPKPRLLDADPEELGRLIDHLKLLASVPVVYRRRRRKRLETVRRKSLGGRRSRSWTGGRIVGIVSSTGGPAVLAEVLSSLPADFSFPVLVVQHLAEDFAPRFVSWLDECSAPSVVLAEDGDRPARGKVLVAPSGAHLFLDKEGVIRLDEASPPRDGHRPSGTRMLESLASVMGPSAIGLLLSGMGSDGAEGLLAMKRAGGVCLAQDEKSSVVFGIAGAASALGAVDRLLPRAEIATALCALERAGKVERTPA